MKIETMSKPLFQQLWRLWQHEALADEFKGPDPFQFMLCESDDVPWYLVDETVFILWKIREGWDAEMLTLNLSEVDRTAAINELHSIFDEYKFQHLTMSVPQPVRRTCRAARRIGFNMEGRIRDAVVYEGIFQDMDILGIRHNEIPVAESRPRRRRRRRKTVEASQAASQSQAEEIEIDGPES